MNLKNSTIKAIGRAITGDGNISPYRSGPRLVEFFNEYGADASYGQGFPSRWQFAEDELNKLNGTPIIKSLVESVVDPSHYLDSEFTVEAVVDHLNQYLLHDRLMIVKKGLIYILVSTDSSIIDMISFPTKFKLQEASHPFILEQIDKCRDKINSEDYDGAITNARSMVEAVFEDLLKNSKAEIPEYKGDLNVLFKAIKKNLNLESSQVDLNDTLKQMLSGLNSIVTSIGGISNKMGDRHARKYKPEKHHALLAINTSYALCEFLISSLEYQRSKGKI